MQHQETPAFLETRILVVEDEPPMLEVVTRLLEAEGLTVVKAQNGAEGLRKFQEAKCDLVIADRAMPLMNGEAMARAIKKMSPETPVILITGLFRAMIDATPFDGFLAKPFTKAQLLSAVEELLPGYRQKAGNLVLTHGSARKG